MRIAHDYESLGYINWRQPRPPLLETYSGTSIVAWHGKIESQLRNLLNDAEKGRNYPYADKIREFLKIWRANEITGSINREILETLKAAADMLSVDNWNLSSYFQSLRDALKVLLASEEELPRDTDMNQNDPYAGGGGGGGGGGGPPMSPAFGPENNPGEGGEAGPAGAGGPEGGPTEIPPGKPEAAGGEPGAPTPEEAGGEGVGPEDMPDDERFGEL